MKKNPKLADLATAALSYQDSPTDEVQEDTNDQQK